MNRRIWSAEEKTAIVLEMVKGDKLRACRCPDCTFWAFVQLQQEAHSRGS